MDDFFFVNRPLILLLKNEIHSGRKLVHDLYTLIECVFFICRTGASANTNNVICVNIKIFKEVR